MARYDRPQLAAFITVAIDLLDALGPDFDVEPNGDELDDPGDLKDASYPEWQSRGRRKLYGGEFEMSNGPEGWHEDAEDDPDCCAAADDIGSGASFFHGSDGMPGDAADAEPEHDAETMMW